MAATITPFKNSREAPKAARSSMETRILTPKTVEQWKVPSFQRPLRINEKVKENSEEIRREEAIGGVLTLGLVEKDPTIWIVDGQHRIEAFKLSGIGEALADVRVCHFESLREMSAEFVRLNSALVRMRPDDVLRGMEPTSPALRRIREQCGFVGYGSIRRSTSQSAPIISMAGLVRCWFGSAQETPISTVGSAPPLVERLDSDTQETQDLITFVLTAFAAWGNDPSYYRLWGALNLTLCMWLFRRLVLEKSGGAKRHVHLNIAQFKQCLMTLSASGDYLDYLTGRMLSDRDRAPCYTRIKSLFAKRLVTDGSDKRPKMPSPDWSTR